MALGGLFFFLLSFSSFSPCFSLSLVFLSYYSLNYLFNRDYPAMVVYHQDKDLDDGSHSWINIGFVGWIG